MGWESRQILIQPAAGVNSGNRARDGEGGRGGHPADERGLHCTAEGTVNPSAMPMTMSRTVSDAVKCFSMWGVWGIGVPYSNDVLVCIVSDKRPLAGSRLEALRPSPKYDRIRQRLP